MKKKYEAPRVEKLEFDYSDIIITSGGGGDTHKCFIGGMGAIWNDNGDACSVHVAGDQ